MTGQTTETKNLINSISVADKDGRSLARYLTMKEATGIAQLLANSRGVNMHVCKRSLYEHTIYVVQPEAKQS
jgi:hypothetical protein